MIRYSTLVSVALLALVCAGVSAASTPTPTPGYYYSTDHPITPGLVLTGRGSTSWIGPHGGSSGTNAVFNSVSYDNSISQSQQNAASLGTQWTYACGVAAGPYSVIDTRSAGNGAVYYSQLFHGGHFFLSKNGPWGDGVNDWTGTIANTNVVTTVIYVMIGGVSTPVQSRVNIDSSGNFDGGCVLQFVIANGTGAGDTDLMAKPADYPDFLDTSCNPTRVYGSFGAVQDITILIDCGTPAKSTTWGNVKTMYR